MLLVFFLYRHVGQTKELTVQSLNTEKMEFLWQIYTTQVISAHCDIHGTIRLLDNLVTLHLHHAHYACYWTSTHVCVCMYTHTHTHTVGSKSFWPDIQKVRQMENAVRDI